MTARITRQRPWVEGCWMRVVEDKLAEAMQESGLSCRQLAAATERHWSTIARLRNGKKPDCSPDTALLIAAVLNKPWSALFVRNMSSAADRNDARLMTKDEASKLEEVASK